MAIVKYAQAEYMDTLMRAIVDRALVDTEITEEEKEKLKKKIWKQLLHCIRRLKIGRRQYAEFYYGINGRRSDWSCNYVPVHIRRTSG